MKRLLSSSAVALALLTCAAPASAWPVLKGAWGHGHTKPPALTIVINPSGQKVTRLGAGDINTGLTYTPGGGTPPYTFTTATFPVGLTVVGPGTTTPQFYATLTNGQDTTYTITGKVHDSLGVVTPATATIEFVSTFVPPLDPLALVITPSTQTQSRVGAGAISAGVTYTPTGGNGIYTFSTTAPGLSISGGTTTTPTVSTTLTGGQDTTYTVTGTLSDTAGTTPASTNASVEFIATAPPVGLALTVLPASQTVTRSGAGSISTGLTYGPSGGTPPYVLSTSAPGLSVSGGTTTTPTVSTTLTNGQDSNFTVTGTVTDALLATVSTPATVEFHSIAPPLALTVTPTTQTKTRAGAGSISTTVTYGPSGGQPPYTLSTAAPGLSISGGTTSTPSVSTTLLDGQDTTYTVTGTLNDSIGSTPVSTPASVEFNAVSAFDPITGSLARGMVADNLAGGSLQAPSKSTSPYTLQPKVVYSSQDIANLVAMGITYVRIPIDVWQILPNLPLPKNYLLETSPGSGIYQPLPTTQTRTVSTTPPLIGPAGCGAIFVTNACFNEFALEYLDQNIAAMEAQGLAVDLVPFVALNFAMPSACTASCPTSSVGGGKDLHDIMGPPLALYGYASYEDMLLQANVTLVNRYRSLYPAAGQIFFEFYNEPDYLGDGSGDPWQNVALWNAATIAITNAIRAIPDTTHWLISDCPQSGKAQHCQYLTPTSDEQTVYSFHKYDPAQMVIQGSGAVRDPYMIYPRPSTGQPAIGRPGGIAPAYMQFPAPVFGTPSGYTTTSTTHCSDSVPLPAGTPVTAWAANATTPVTTHSQKVCQTTSGNSPQTNLVDYYTGGSGSLEVTKADFLTNTTDGIQIALDWAAAGGHSGSRSGEPLKIIAGEIGVTRSVDYLSSLQLLQDLIDTLNTSGVVGGQAKIPWDYWAFSGVQFGFRPKSQPTLTHWCLNASGVLAGYDKDWYARLSFPQGSMTPNCSGGSYASPGY